MLKHKEYKIADQRKGKQLKNKKLFNSTENVKSPLQLTINPLFSFIATNTRTSLEKSMGLVKKTLLLLSSFLICWSLSVTVIHTTGKRRSQSLMRVVVAGWQHKEETNKTKQNIFFLAFHYI